MSEKNLLIVLLNYLFRIFEIIIEFGPFDISPFFTGYDALFGTSVEVFYYV